MEKDLYQKITKFLFIGGVISTCIAIVVIVLNHQTLYTHFSVMFDYTSAYNSNNNLAEQLALNHILRKELIQVICSVAFAFFFWFGYWVRHDFFEGRSLWEESLGICGIFLSATFMICYVCITYDNNSDMDLIINSSQDLDNFKAKENSKSAKEKPVYIPTGIYLQSVEFTSSNNCILTAQVWQRYEKGTHDTITKGFVLPEAQEAEIEENYRKTFGNSEVIGWTVKATIREVFHFGEYPFDHQNFWVRLWPKDFDEDVILVPDMKSYVDYKPDKLPGIEKFIVVQSWAITNAFFGYKYNSYNTNFGIDSYVGLNNFPELYYNVFIQRDFVSVFISDLVPVIMTIAILFIALVVSFKPEEGIDDFFSFNVMEVIGLAAALIFVVLLAHIELRGRIFAETVLYIEYYYFITYIAIFAILANYLVLRKHLNVPFVYAKNNYYPKILFLPLISFMMLCATILVFY